jgi:DNA helicase-2/ATP-dependent DNA helicase PcrA
LEEDLFPSQLSKNNERNIEEERRLFYVAITRAEENCVLSYAKSRFQNGQSRMSAPSRFIKDIDKKYLKLPSNITFDQPVPENFSRFDSPRKTSFERSWENKPETTPIFTSQTKQLTKIDRIQSIPQTPTNVTLQNMNGLAIGNTIEHERFGIGKITGLEGSNENAKAIVEFENTGKKQLLLKFAKFKLIDNLTKIL